MFLWLPLSLSKSELFPLIRFSFQNWQFSMMCDTFYNKFQRPARCPSSVQHPPLFPLSRHMPRISLDNHFLESSDLEYRPANIFLYWPPTINIANLPPLAGIPSLLFFFVLITIWVLILLIYFACPFPLLSTEECKLQESEKIYCFHSL